MARTPEVWNLENDLQEVLSSWFSRKDAIPEHWKGDTITACPMPFDEALALGRERSSKLVSRARKMTRRLEQIVDTLSGILSAVQTEFEAARESFIAVSKTHSLVILPNELLARIFDFVVNWNSNEYLGIRPRTPAAVKLSHVCRYFRETALSCAELWANTSEDRNMLAFCLSRSKLAPLNLYLEVRVEETGPESDEFRLVCDPYVEDLLPHSKRWGQLEIATEVTSEAFYAGAESSDIGQLFRGLDVPSLHSLRILRDGTEPILISNLLDGWNTPNLRHITFKHYLPFRLRGAENLRSFDVTLEVRYVKLVDILTVLSSMTVLEDLCLTLTVPQIFEAPNVQPLERADLPSIRRLHLGLSRLGVIESPTRRLLRTLFSLLSFPRTTELHLNLAGEFQDNIEGVLLEREVMCLFYRPDTFPCVERYSLEVFDYSDFGPDEGQFLTCIPFDKLPSMKELKLCSNTRLVPRPYFPGTASLLLERLIIETTEIGMRAMEPFVTSVMKGMKDEGKWENFQELVVTHTDEMVHILRGTRRASKSFVGDAALQWSTNGVPDIPAFD